MIAQIVRAIAAVAAVKNQCVLAQIVEVVILLIIQDAHVNYVMLINVNQISLLVLIIHLVNNVLASHALIHQKINAMMIA